MDIEERRIVLVNVNKSILNVLRGILEHRNYQLVSINEVSNLEYQNVYLVLFQFHEFSFSEFKHLYKLRELYSDTPLIILSAFFSTQHVFSVGKAGASEFVQLPIEPERLHEFLNKYLGLS